jgi:hypothetical protein
MSGQKIPTLLFGEVTPFFLMQTLPISQALYFIKKRIGGGAINRNNSAHL